MAKKRSDRFVVGFKGKKLIWGKPSVNLANGAAYSYTLDEAKKICKESKWLNPIIYELIHYKPKRKAK